MYQKNVLYRARLAVTPEPWVTLFEGLLSIYLLWLALTQTYGASTDHVTRSVYHDFNVYPSESVRLDTCYDSLRVGLLFPEALFDTNNS